MKKETIFSLLFMVLLFVITPSFAQISAGGTPPSFIFETENAWLSSTIDMPITFDVAAMRAEDVTRKLENLPPRVGKIISVNLTTENSGEWTTLPNGQQIWRLCIYAENALGIMLTYDKFEIPVGGKLFLYNDDRSGIIGAFTEESNPKRVEFATEFIQGDMITVEYVAPLSGASASPIVISGVAYGYNNLFFENEEETGESRASGACEVNINCPEGSNWQDQKKGVARLTIPDGAWVYYCSGSVVNNTSGNLDPLVLTAYHCFADLGASNVNQTVFNFHYEYNACTGGGAASTKTMTGAQILVNVPTSQASDGTLLRLNQAIPAAYDVYYNGWDKRNTAATSGVCIHHPDGDRKKISTFTATLVSSGNINLDGNIMAPNSVWRVIWAQTQTNWGVTEGGSSGSPLFNQDKRIVGTLSGGSSYCSTPSQPDYYGKLWYHWDRHSTQQMKTYLDPTNSGLEYIDGTYTAGVSSYTITATAGANGKITPSGSVTVAPGANQTFTFEANSEYEINQVLVDGSNNPGAVTNKSYTFTNVTANHTISVSFKAISSSFIPVTNITQLPLDATTGTPLTLTGNIIPSNATNQTITWSIVDAGTTGATLTGNIFNTTGPGNAIVRATIVNGSAVGTDYKKAFNISVTGVGIAESAQKSGIVVFPNPTTGEIHVACDKLQVTNIEVFDIFGRKLSFNHLINSSSNHLINISHLSNGIYFLKVDEKVMKVIKN